MAHVFTVVASSLGKFQAPCTIFVPACGGRCRPLSLSLSHSPSLQKWSCGEKKPFSLSTPLLGKNVQCCFAAGPGRNEQVASRSMWYLLSLDSILEPANRHFAGNAQDKWAFFVGLKQSLPDVSIGARTMFKIHQSPPSWQPWPMKPRPLMVKMAVRAQRCQFGQFCPV